MRHSTPNISHYELECFDKKQIPSADRRSLTRSLGITRSKITVESMEPRISKIILQKILEKSTLKEIQQSIHIGDTHLFNSVETVDWLFKCCTKDVKSILGKASAIAIACLSFPTEIIPGIRDRLFQTNLLSSIIDIAGNDGIPLAHHVEKQEITIKEKIGAGAGGFVHKAIYKGNHVAVKFFRKEGIWMGTRKEFYRDCALVSLFGSFRHFIHCIGVNCKEGFMVMPLAINGSLNTWLEEDMFWSIKNRMAYQIAEAMKTLHHYGIVDRDLKPANVLLDADFNCYLCDFGTSTSSSGKSRTMTLNVGTTIYMAPEMISGTGKYSQSVDVFSFAVLLWQICSKSRYPYTDQGISLNEQVSFITSGNRLPVTNDCPLHLEKLISKCWEQNPKKRPSFEDIATILLENQEKIGQAVSLK